MSYKTLDFWPLRRTGGTGQPAHCQQVAKVPAVPPSSAPYSQLSAPKAAEFACPPVALQCEDIPTAFVFHFLIQNTWGEAERGCLGLRQLASAASFDATGQSTGWGGVRSTKEGILPSPLRGPFPILTRLQFPG